MTKRVIFLLLALALLLPMLPRLTAGAKAAGTEDLRQTIAAQYDAYAASIAQPGADEGAIRQMLNHSIDHPGQNLVMGEKDVFTASLLQAGLFREYVLQALMSSFSIIEMKESNQLLVGCRTLKWYDHVLQYKLNRYHYNETISPDDDDYSRVLISDTQYTGARNKHDKAMCLLIGTGISTIRLKRVSANSQTVSYRVSLMACDSFDFNATYNGASADGYDTSTEMLITLAGKLFLNPFDWMTLVEFDIEIPNNCPHQTMNYRWEGEGRKLETLSDEWFRENPLQICYREINGEQTYYYRMTAGACLEWQKPWVVEFRVKGGKALALGAEEFFNYDSPFLLKSSDYLAIVRHWEEYETDPVTGEEKRVPFWRGNGCRVAEQGHSNMMWHTYRFENRIADDGTNMVYGLIDGQELGPLDKCYFKNEQMGQDAETYNWFTGQNLYIRYIGGYSWTLKETFQIDYINILENGETTEPYDCFETTVTVPSCTEPGRKIHTCTRCGAVEEEALEPALGHVEELLPGAAPTCDSEGLTDGTRCTVCGDVVTAQTVIPALGHSWDVGVVTAEPTCTQPGIMTHICTADPAHTKTEAIAMLPHTSVTDKAVAATCTAGGLPEGAHCGECGAVLVPRETIPALGHSWDAGRVIAEPTPEASGILRYRCTVCGEEKDAEIPYEAPVRLAGSNRFETAFLVADAMKAELGIEKFDTVIVASGTNFADALSGSYLASVKNAPILLSYTTDSINDRVKDYIQANLSEGGTVYILGGEAAVPGSVEEGLDAFAVKRLAGKDRFGTNLTILSEAGVEGKDLLVCTGLDFADSLSASAAGLPILLVWKELTDTQKFFLDAAKPEKIYIIGGENAVSRDLERSLSPWGNTCRVGGENRFATSVTIAETFFESPEAAVLAYAWNYPDGLCGGPLAAAMDAPLLLTMEGWESAAAAYMGAQGAKKGAVLGGETLLPEDSVVQIFGVPCLYP